MMIKNKRKTEWNRDSEIKIEWQVDKIKGELISDDEKWIKCVSYNEDAITKEIKHR